MRKTQKKLSTQTVRKYLEIFHKYVGQCILHFPTVMGVMMLIDNLHVFLSFKWKVHIHFELSMYLLSFSPAEFVK